MKQLMTSSPVNLDWPGMTPSTASYRTTNNEIRLIQMKYKVISIAILSQVLRYFATKILQFIVSAIKLCVVEVGFQLYTFLDRLIMAFIIHVKQGNEK